MHSKLKTEHLHEESVSSKQGSNPPWSVGELTFDPVHSACVYVAH